MKQIKGVYGDLYTAKDRLQKKDYTPIYVTVGIVLASVVVLAIGLLAVGTYKIK